MRRCSRFQLSEAAVTIQLKCTCGAAYKVPDDSAGRKLQCKHCSAIIAIPPQASSTPAAAPAEDPPETPPALPKPNKKRASKAARQGRRQEEADRRRHNRRRAWIYITSGLSFIIMGLAFTWLFLAYSNANSLDVFPSWLRVIHKVSGNWGPLILGTIVGLFPIAVGILNLLGISFVLGWYEQD
jgi:hypothetical protein